MKTSVEDGTLSRGENRTEKPSIKMSGYLEKKGKLRVMSTWKRYWFVLEGRLLLYYKSQQEYLRLSPCRGSLNMGLASRVRPGPGTDRDDGHLLEVVLRAHVVTLRAKDRPSQEQWLKALLDCMVSPSLSTPSKDSRAQLHFRYPSADQANCKEVADSIPTRKEKHRPLPASVGTLPAALPSVAERIFSLGRHSNGDAGADVGSRAGSKHQQVVDCQRRTSRAVYPVDNPDFSSPFGHQRYSFHCLRKGDDVESGSPQTVPRNLRKKVLNKSMENIDVEHLEREGPNPRNIEALLKKQLSYTSIGSWNKNCLVSLKDAKHSLSNEELGREKFKGVTVLPAQSCIARHSLVKSGESMDCYEYVGGSCHDEEKENIEKKKWGLHSQSSAVGQYHPDENQNQRFVDDYYGERRMKMRSTNLDRNHSGSEIGILGMSGVDLSFSCEDVPELHNSTSCTSADKFWSVGTICSEKNSRYKDRNMDRDVEYLSVGDVPQFANHSPEPEASRPHDLDKEKKCTHVSLRQRILHEDGEYVKYSEPEDCDKRDTTLNTTSESCQEDSKSKPKLRLKKRKATGSKDLTEINVASGGTALKKRASVRNRLSFLSRVLSHVRRPRDDSTESLEENSTCADINGLPKSTPTPQRDSEAAEKIMDNSLEGPNTGTSVSTNFQPGLSDTFPGEAPEEPPPDYDSVTLDSITEAAPSSSSDNPPQLPPRRMKRPRSPWHDVPTNNSPVVDMDNEARQRLLSAAKYGRVIGTRGSQNMESYEWNELAQHHAYEVVSDDTSPAGSNEHLAIYLSSESSDDEFHEEVVLRQNFRETDFLFDGVGRSKRSVIGNGHSVLKPLSIDTHNLPTIDSFGRVGLSHVEAVKLNLLIQAQRNSTGSAKMNWKEGLGRKTYEGLGEPENDKTLNISDYVSQFRNSCLLKLPEESADQNFGPAKEQIRLGSEEVIGDVQSLLAPVEELIKKFMDKRNSQEAKLVPSLGPNMSDGGSEIISQVCKSGKRTTLSSGHKISQDVQHGEPPELPAKTKPYDRVDRSCETNERHSDELNILLTQLANMTTAPLLRAGATCSMHTACAYSEFDGGQGGLQHSTHKQESLSLGAVHSTYDDSEPDYDVPRPHASLLHLLPEHTRHHSTRGEDGDIMVEATHFFTSPKSPRTNCAGEHSWTGNMSPDSLDVPPKRPHTWEINATTLDELSQGCMQRKERGEKDRNRRATLSGPIVDLPISSVYQRQKPQLIRRNSLELIECHVANTWQIVEKNHTDKQKNYPKQIEHFKSTCEHYQQPGRLNSGSAYISNLCKKHELSTSLENISGRLEVEQPDLYKRRLGAETILSCRDTLKLEESDFDSLELSELKNMSDDLLEKKSPVLLVSIVEEQDVVSDRSIKSDDDSPSTVRIGEGMSSCSASEGALMCEGDSESKETDQQTTHTTDTDMELISDDDVEPLEFAREKKACALQIIEPDSLLQESLACTSTACHRTQNTDEAESTKDASFETDSLEPKK